MFLDFIKVFLEIIIFFFECLLLGKTELFNKTSSAIKNEVVKMEHCHCNRSLLDDQEFIDKFRPYLPSGARLSSKEDVYNLITRSSQDPFVVQMAKVRNAFGSKWPPRASFDNWPKEWDPYMEMAEEMSFRMRDLDSPARYRAWILSKCSEIDIKTVKRQLEEKWQTAFHSPDVYGLMGALAKLLLTFRWGKLPVSQEELDRKTLTFPAELMEVFEMISHHYGTKPIGSLFNSVNANVMYVEGKEEQQGGRFFLIAEENKRLSERNFFNSVTHMDQKFGKSLPIMTQYMALTNFAFRGGPEIAMLLLDQRVKCLKLILHDVKEMFKIFRGFMNEEMVQTKYLGPYIQGPAAWNINGESEGMSGAENFSIMLLDAFLGIKGTCLVSRVSFKKLSSFPKVCRDLVLILTEDSNLDKRFVSHLDLEDDPILRVKDDILHVLYCWRLGHAKLPLKYFGKDCKTTASGVTELISEDKTVSLGEQAEKHLRLRALETKACIVQLPKGGL